MTQQQSVAATNATLQECGRVPAAVCPVQQGRLAGWYRMQTPGCSILEGRPQCVRSAQPHCGSRCMHQSGHLAVQWQGPATVNKGRCSFCRPCNSYTEAVLNRWAQLGIQGLLRHLQESHVSLAGMPELESYQQQQAVPVQVVTSVCALAD